MTGDENDDIRLKRDTQSFLVSCSCWYGSKYLLIYKYKYKNHQIQIQIFHRDAHDLLVLAGLRCWRRPRRPTRSQPLSSQPFSFAVQPTARWFKVFDIQIQIKNHQIHIQIFNLSSRPFSFALQPTAQVLTGILNYVLN